MNKLFLTIILALNSIYSFSQENENSNSYYYKNLGIQLTIDWDTTGTYQYLTVHDNDKPIKYLKLNYEVDPYDFNIDYLGERKFSIIRGRYQFYIFNLSTKILIGPYKATPRDYAVDAQSGMLADMEIFNKGQYLMIRVVDFGIYCYNLMDIYNPFEVECYVSKDFPYHHFFLDKRSNGLYNGILSSTDNGWDIINTSFLFKGHHFKEDSNRRIKKKKIKDRYLLLTRYVENSNVDEPFIVDYQDGKILNNKSDKKLIMKISK